MYDECNFLRMEDITSTIVSSSIGTNDLHIKDVVSEVDILYVS